MEKQPLIIGIDYTNEYCQACYYNLHHERPESVMTGAAVMRYLIPAVLCFDKDREDWLIGEEAMLYAEQTGTYLFRDLLKGMLDGETCEINGSRHTYDSLVAVFFGKLLELIQIHSGLTAIDNITVTMRQVNLEVKKAIENVFDLLQVDPEKVSLLSYAESFAYYILNEDENLWQDGAVLFDFDYDGFFVKQLTLAGTPKRPLLYVNERNHSMDFFIKDLASELLRNDLDAKLTELFEDIRFSGPRSSVFFTGTGFSELWFTNTLELISASCRVFKGNNLYVKGACLRGYIRCFKEGRDYPIVCKGRTKASVSLVNRCKGEVTETELSKAACDWYEAGSVTDFILDSDRSCEFIITSLVSRERTSIMFDLSSFPDRPPLTTRVEVSVRYLNDAECEIKVTDKGFGSFFAGSGACVTKRLNLEGYI